uniref:ULP_PROTEASE domain-containing protein n=1 Tax=Meloidogyne hapla TaxID=6305 RepID=A0A1I8B5N0_MELHA
MPINDNAQYIDFSTLDTLDFAVRKTADQNTICRRAVMPLYERDIDNTGPRALETMWNKLSEWPNESFIFAYLCYLAKISGKKVIVVDPLITEPAHQQLEGLAYEQYAYQTDQDRDVEVLLLPVHFPGHWTIIIFDSEFGFYFFDSLPIDPYRLSEQHTDYHPDRMPKLKEIISQLTNTSEYLIHIATYATNEYTLQQDGHSCGYFICLYAEAWIMNNRNLHFLNFNINTEKKRILWHLNQLYSGDNVEYHPRNEQIQRPPQQIHDLPAASQSTPRRASKLTSSNLTPGMSTISVATPKGERVLPLKRCCAKHKGMGCASFNSGHLPEYYNSGQFGDRTCVHCNNRLLRSEKCLSCTDDYERLVSGTSMDSKEYIKDESKYNTLFAFGSLSVGRQNAPLGGPMPENWKLNLADDHQIPSCDQLYILDSQVATDFRMNNISFDDWTKRSRHLFHILDELIRNNHPMAAILNNSYEFYKDLAQNDPDKLQSFKIILVEDKNAPAAIQDPNLHPKTS